MAFCSHCGTQIEDGAHFCPSCGAQQAQGASGAQGQAYSAAPKSDEQDIRDNKGMAILSYIGPLCFVPYFAAKDSPFAQYHGVRGVNFFIIAVIGGIVSSVLGGIPFIGWMIALGISGLTIYLMVMGIINASRGERKDLPLIGSIRIVKEPS